MAMNRAQATGFILSAIIVAAVAAYLLIGTQTGFPPGGQGYRNPYPDGSGGSTSGQCCTCTYQVNYPPNPLSTYEYKTGKTCITKNDCAACPPDTQIVRELNRKKLTINVQGDPYASPAILPATYTLIVDSNGDLKGCSGAAPCTNQPIPAPAPDGGGGGGAGGNPPPAKDRHCNCLYACTANSGKLSTSSQEGNACGAMGGDCTSTCSTLMLPLPNGMKSCVLTSGSYVGSECA